MMNLDLPQKTILSMQSISKEFPGSKALQNVDFDLKEGEVHAIVGANGAGKSTLINILGGVYSDYSGLVRINGTEAKINNPRKSQRLGITLITQELNLVNDFTVSENIYLGNEPFLMKSMGIIDRTSMLERSASNLNKFGFDLNPRTRVAELSALEKQIVMIVKALERKSTIIIMDEPTAILTANETYLLYDTIANLSQQKISVIFISHRFEDIFEVSDRVTVLRDGRKVFETETQLTSNDEIVSYMLGEESFIIRKEVYKQNSPKKLLSVHNLKSRTLKDISFDLYEGEILGVIGKPGAGKHELLRTICGVEKFASCKIQLGENEIFVNKPKSAIDYGICFLSEDRRQDGLFPLMAVTDNITMPYLQELSLMGFVNVNKARTITKIKVAELKIKISDILQPVVYLSGGNQQKVILARWLCNKNAKLFIFEEPTKGIDIVAKSEIYSIINKFKINGNGCIVMSSDLDELMLLSDRIIVIENGCISNITETSSMSKHDLLEIVMGTRTYA